MRKAIKTDILKIGRLELTVFILDDGRRIIEQNSIGLSEEESLLLAKFIKGL
jgi:hypothetical protein